MKKLYLLILSFLCLCASSAFANSPCDSEMKSWSWQNWKMANHGNCQKPCKSPCKKSCQTPCESKCPQTYSNPCSTDAFLCTNQDINYLFTQMNLSETQKCTAMKIQDKYDQEVLSLNERIQCEEENMNSLKRNCAKRSQLRKQNRTIKDLKKKRKEICKCYEKEFKTILSDPQRKAYNKYKKVR